MCFDHCDNVTVWVLWLPCLCFLRGFGVFPFAGVYDCVAFSSDLLGFPIVGLLVLVFACVMFLICGLMLCYAVLVGGVKSYGCML